MMLTGANLYNYSRREESKRIKTAVAETNRKNTKNGHQVNKPRDWLVARQRYASLFGPSITPVACCGCCGCCVAVDASSQIGSA